MIPNALAAAGLIAMQNNGFNLNVERKTRSFEKKERGTPAPIPKKQYETATARPILSRKERHKILQSKTKNK